MARCKDSIEQLLINVFQDAPQMLHHVFALDGANEMLSALNTLDSKAAYLIQMIALELYKACKEMNPKKLSTGPNDIKFHIVQVHNLFPSGPFDIIDIDLGAFEDLYYAACAKLKELLHGANIYLNNGFKAASDTSFNYRCHPLNSLDPINFGDFKASLLVYERILYSNELTELLHHGIVTRHAQNNTCDNNSQHEHVPAVVGESLEHKDSRTYVQLPARAFPKDPESPTNNGGLQDTTDMSCGMIYGTLAEKYRSIVSAAGSLGASIERQPTPDAPQARRKTESKPTYISPYNLDERAKKLNDPNGPEMPCICDPDCMCIPVCASDPTQNCLCEENGLFVRVTQGMDIDELDVPDLVRYDRPGSDGSGSSVVSLPGDVETLPGTPEIENGYAVVENAFDYFVATADTREQNRKEQPLTYLSPDKMGTWNPVEKNHMLPTSAVSQLESLEYQSKAPPRVSSLAYREALRQPFSKLCDHPPKRLSVAQRLFGSRRRGLLGRMKASNGPSANALKQLQQRSHGDFSFTDLKISLRQDLGECTFKRYE